MIELEAVSVHTFVAVSAEIIVLPLAFNERIIPTSSAIATCAAISIVAFLL